MDDYAEKLTAKLAPESVARTLIHAGCFLSAYELIKSEVVDKVHDFYLAGFDEHGLTYDEASYQRQVLSRNPKSKYRASCSWLVENDALTAEEVATLEEIHQHRQEIAHELPKLLVDPDFEVKTDLLLAAVDCVRTLGVFWGRITVDTDPQWDGKDVADEDIKSGSYLLMEYLASLAGLSSKPAQERKESPVE
jgi:uncharacterized protein (DUF1697 family)